MRREKIGGWFEREEEDLQAEGAERANTGREDRNGKEAWGDYRFTFPLSLSMILSSQH